MKRVSERLIHELNAFYFTFNDTLKAYTYTSVGLTVQRAANPNRLALFRSREFPRRNTKTKMTHTRLAGGYADVPVDVANRTIDGDSSGDLYSGLEKALEGKVAAPVTFLRASRQVVAGLNWKLLIPIDDQSCYEAIILQQLPCNGGGFRLTHFEQVPRPSASLVAHPLEDGEETLEECDQSVSFALQSLSDQSNSLAPFELVKLVRATRTGPVHDLKLEVRQGAKGNVVPVEMIIQQDQNGFHLDKLAFL